MYYSTKGGLTLKIPLNEIEKIEYVLGTQPTESILSAKKRTGADYIINANFFDMRTGKTQGEVVDEGKVLSSGMNPYGYGFIDKKTPVFSYKNNVKAIDFVGGYPCLLRNGKVDPMTAKYLNGMDYDRKRGRTAIGLTNDSFVVRVIPDKTLYPRKTIPGMVAEMVTLGCINAINLDGGGSSQFVSPDKTFNSGRNVDGFICIWTKKQGTEPPKTTEYYTVQKGDNLFKIANKTGSSVSKLAELNGIKNVNLIFPGQRLKVK